MRQKVTDTRSWLAHALGGRLGVGYGLFVVIYGLAVTLRSVLGVGLGVLHFLCQCWEVRGGPANPLTSESSAAYVSGSPLPTFLEASSSGVDAGGEVLTKGGAGVSLPGESSENRPS